MTSIAKTTDYDYTSDYALLYDGHVAVTSSDLRIILDALRANDAERTWVSFKIDPGKALKEALERNTVAKTLIFATKIGDGTGDASIIALGEALKTNTALTEINCFDTLRVAAAVPLVNTLKFNTALQTLKFALKAEEDVALVGEALGEALKINTTLKSFFCCGLGERGNMAVCEALKTNMALTSLTISDKAGSALGEMLKTNKTLTSLWVLLCVSDAVASSLENALESNRSLKHLTLFGTVTHETIEKISSALHTNPVLLSLDIKGTGSPSLSREALALLARNRELLQLWVSVARVVQRGEAPGLRDLIAALTPSGFQEKIFRFFWPRFIMRSVPIVELSERRGDSAGDENDDDGNDAEEQVEEGGPRRKKRKLT